MKTATLIKRAFLFLLIFLLVIFQLTNDKCDLADKVKPGDNVDVSFDIVGNESRDRFFVNLNAYRIERN